MLLIYAEHPVQRLIEQTNLILEGSERVFGKQEDELMNTPCLSLNDLISVWGMNGTEFKEAEYSPLFKRFKELVKTK